MVKSRRIRLVFSLFLMVSLVAAVILAQTPVFAADATPTSPSIAQPTLVLDSTYPVISADSGQSSLLM